MAGDSLPPTARSEHNGGVIKADYLLDAILLVAQGGGRNKCPFWTARLTSNVVRAFCVRFLYENYPKPVRFSFDEFTTFFRAIYDGQNRRVTFVAHGARKRLIFGILQAFSGNFGRDSY